LMVVSGWKLIVKIALG